MLNTSGHAAVNLSRLVGNLKTVSARGLRKEFAAALKPYYWRPVLWSASYAAFTGGRRRSWNGDALHPKSRVAPGWVTRLTHYREVVGKAGCFIKAQRMTPGRG